MLLAKSNPVFGVFCFLAIFVSQNLAEDSVPETLKKWIDGNIKNVKIEPSDE